MKYKGCNQRLAFVLLVGVIFSGLWAAADCRAGNESGQKDSDSKPVIRLGDLLKAQDFEPDQRHVHAILKEAFSSESAGDAWNIIDEKQVVFISAEEAAVQALRKNLLIKVSQDDSEAAKEAIQEAEAVFFPVLRFAVSYAESDTHERGAKEVALITKSWSGYTPIDIMTDPDKPPPQVNGLKLVAQPGLERVTRALNASEDQDNGPTETTQYTIGISQQLPWGPVMDISMVTTDREVYYDKEGRSYGASWTSSALLNLLLPLPWTKGFGPNAPQDIAIKLTEKNSEQSYWVVKSSINTILLAADLAYWDMVQSFENLNTAIENKKLVEKQQAIVNKRFEDGEATNYDKLQIEAELANAVLQEEIARNNSLSACYGLAELIMDDPEKIRTMFYLPAEYLKKLEQIGEIDTEGALDMAEKKRPEIQTNRVGKEKALLSESLAKNQTRPDLILLAGLSVSQDGATYGYKDPGDSWGSITDPDTLTHSYSLLYNYPFGNRALKSALNIQRTVVKDQDALARTTENQIVNEVNDALSDIYSAQQRAALAREILQFAEYNYDRVRNREAGEIKQYELILNLQRLNSSKLSLISALIDLKKAVTRLHAAQGTIAENYVKAVSLNPLDRLRLDIMAANGALKYFRPDETVGFHETSIQ